MKKLTVTVASTIFFFGCIQKKNNLEKAEYYFEKGLEYTLNQSDSLALIYYDSASTYIEDAALFTNRGSTKWNLRDTLGALEDFKAALEADGEYETALFNLGLLYAEWGEWATALEYLKKSLEIDSTQSEINLSIGYCYYMLEDYREALDALMKHLGSDYPVNFNYAIELATDCFEKLGNKEDMEWWQEQLQLFKKADQGGILNIPD